MHCPHDGCGWRPISASASGAEDQLATHIVEEHAREVDAEVPDGMVQVRTPDDDEWRTMTPEDAKALHEARHGDEES